MSFQFYPLVIADIRPETPDTKSIAFTVPDALKPLFAFTQGQHLTLKATINGLDLRRNYSLCTSPTEGEWRVAIKKVPGGAFSSFVHTQLHIGDTLEVMPPMGKYFTPLQPQQARHYMAIAAGSGITPIISIIKTTLATEPQSRFTLVYANKNRGSIIFKDALDALKNTYISRFQCLHILSREQTDTDLLHGRIDANKCDQLFSRLIQLNRIDEIFICGPQALTETIRQYLQAAGVEKNKIHFELFGTDNRALSTPEAEPETVGESATITVKLDGRDAVFPLPFRGQSILDAALAQGLNLPFACKGGVCCTCKARLISGQVHMGVHYGLEQDEIDAGFVLTCQSHPLTPEVVVEFQ